MEQYKTCTKCGQIKVTKDFGHLHGKPGARCRSCMRAYQKQWVAQNYDKARQYNRTYHDKNPGLRTKWNREWRLANAEQRAIYLAEYRERNKFAIAARAKAYRLENLEQIRKRAREYQKKNPELFRRHSAKRRALTTQVDVRIVSQEELIKLLQNPCLYCGAKSEHIDHIIPLSRGGRHSIGNLTGACASCNLSKGAKFLTEWRRDEARRFG